MLIRLPSVPVKGLLILLALTVIAVPVLAASSVWWPRPSGDNLAPVVGPTSWEDDFSDLTGLAPGLVGTGRNDVAEGVVIAGAGLTLRRWMDSFDTSGSVTNNWQEYLNQGSYHYTWHGASQSLRMWGRSDHLDGNWHDLSLLHPLCLSGRVWGIESDVRAANLPDGVWARRLQTFNTGTGNVDYGLQTRAWPNTFRVVRYLAETGWTWGGGTNTSWHHYRFRLDTDSDEGTFWRDGSQDADYNNITDNKQCIDPVLLISAAAVTGYNPNVDTYFDNVRVLAMRNRVRSVLITPTPGAQWDQVFWTGATPGATSIQVDVLDGATEAVLLSDVSSGQSLAGIDPVQHPTLRLQATLDKGGFGPNFPTLDRWRVTWINPTPTPTNTPTDTPTPTPTDTPTSTPTNTPTPTPTNTPTNTPTPTLTSTPTPTSTPTSTSTPTNTPTPTPTNTPLPVPVTLTLVRDYPYLVYYGANLIPPQPSQVLHGNYDGPLPRAGRTVSIEVYDAAGVSHWWNVTTDGAGNFTLSAAETGDVNFGATERGVWEATAYIIVGGTTHQAGPVYWEVKWFTPHETG